MPDQEIGEVGHRMLMPWDVSFVYLGYLMHCVCDSSLLQPVMSPESRSH